MVLKKPLFAKKPRRRRAPAGRRQIYGAAGRQLYSDVMKLKSLINVEFKYVFTTGTTTPSSIPTVATLNLVPQGDTAKKRDGKSVRMKSVRYRYRATIHASATQTTARVILGIWKRPNGTGVTSGELLETTADITSMPNQDNKRDYVILRDFDVDMSITGNNTFSGDHYIPLDLKTVYSDDNTDGAVTGMEDGQIFLLLASNEATNTPTVKWTSQVVFLDN